ncbi:uncharacterized protein LOC141912272 [Tubulanus polymorphus]|uniref:uncharacterized protein LOC141912272 n=1 Tax=Tubulanus polymorphus TaxID=672921 RepID=UPI003DA2899D
MSERYTKKEDTSPGQKLQMSSSAGRSEDIPAWVDEEGGLKVATATVFIVGEMAGSGVLALPKATVNTGYIGVLILIVCTYCAAYTGSILGKCWMILQERYPEYRQPTRYPYPAIGYRACGPAGRYLVSLCNNVTLFGVSTVFVIMAAEILQDLCWDYGLKMSACYWLLVIAAILIPFTWLGSPKDMWPLAIGAMLTTIVATVLVLIKLVMAAPLMKDIEITHTPPNLKPDGIKHAFMAFGTMIYAFGNHPIFPTIQHDMTEPKKFTTVVFCGFTAVILLYLPIVIGGYVVFGDTIQDNILSSLNAVSPGPILTVIQILFALHLLFGFVIAINPFCQEVEDLFKIEQKFTWKRAVGRTLIVCMILFVAESVPKFGAILALIGGSTTALLSFILPCVFYTRLCNSGGVWQKRFVPLHKTVFHYELIIIAVIAGSISTYAAIEDIVSPDTFVYPCYVNASLFL